MCRAVLLRRKLTWWIMGSNSIAPITAILPGHTSPMAPRRLTIQDVAEKVGLSKFSVSRALSGKPGVGEATRARVLQAAHTMGYRIDQSLAAKPSQILFIRQEIDPVASELWLNVMH